MKLRVVGAHNFASRDHRLACLLVDDVIALDAGSLSVGLTFEEQRRVRAAFISHRHYDHIRDLLVFGLAASYMGTSIDVFGPAPTVNAIADAFFGSGLYPDPRTRPSAERPAVRLHVVEAHKSVSLDGGYTVQSTPVVHAVEATGYEVTGPDGRRVFYSGDTGPGVTQAWPHIRPHLIALECTLDDAMAERAKTSVHLTPRTFGEALTQFRRTHAYLPKVVAVHLSPFSEAKIRAELPVVGLSLGTDIAIAGEGDVFDV